MYPSHEKEIRSLEAVNRGATNQQRWTKCKKAIKQQNNELFCYIILKQQSKKPSILLTKPIILLTKPMFFCQTTKQQNMILFIFYSFVSNNKIEQNAILTLSEPGVGGE